MTSPSFVRRVKANAEHLLGLVRSIEDREYRSLDQEWHNLLQAIEFGLGYPEALAETAELWAALIGFIESRGYFGTWQQVTRRLAEKVHLLPPEQACRIANEAGFFLEKSRDLELALAMHLLAAEQAGKTGNALDQALAILGVSNIQNARRQYAEAESNVMSVLGILDDLDTTRLQYAGALTVLTILKRELGEYAAAEGWAELAAREYLNAGHHRKAAAAKSLAGMAMLQSGRFREAVAILESALDLLKPGIDHLVRTNLYVNVGTAYFELGEYTRAKEAFLSIDRAFLEKHGLQVQLMYTLNNLGNVAMQEKEWEAAQDYLESSIGLARILGDGVNLGNSLGDLGQVLLQLGAPREALAAMDEAIETLSHYPENAWARKRLAAILAQRRDAFD